MYAKIEMGRLNFLRLNQDTLRSDHYKGAVDAIQSNDSTLASSIGAKIILPSSFIGGDRQMAQLDQDAMSIMRVQGKPDIFVTITTNPNWIEIQNELLPHETSNDRPDLITRVFNLKLKALIDDILNKNILGLCIAHLYVIEWQKRGLPHAHLL